MLLENNDDLVDSRPEAGTPIVEEQTTTDICSAYVTMTSNEQLKN